MSMARPGLAAWAAWICNRSIDSILEKPRFGGAFLFPGRSGRGAIWVWGSGPGAWAREEAPSGAARRRASASSFWFDRGSSLFLLPAQAPGPEPQAQIAPRPLKGDLRHAAGRLRLACWGLCRLSFAGPLPITHHKRALWTQSP